MRVRLIGQQPHITDSVGGGPRHRNSTLAEPDDHALGRSRGGLTTKIHALTDTATCPVAMTLTPGQGGDNPALLPLVDGQSVDRAVIAEFL